MLPFQRIAGLAALALAGALLSHGDALTAEQDGFRALYVGPKRAASAATAPAPPIAAVTLRPMGKERYQLRFAFGRPVDPKRLHVRIYLDADGNRDTGRRDNTANRGTDHFVVYDGGKLNGNSYTKTGKRIRKGLFSVKAEPRAFTVEVKAPPLKIDQDLAARLYVQFWVGDTRRGAARIPWATLKTSPSAPPPPPKLNSPEAVFTVKKNFRALTCYDQDLPKRERPRPWTDKQMATWRRLRFPPVKLYPYQADFAKSDGKLDFSDLGLKVTFDRRKGCVGRALRLRGSRQEAIKKGLDVRLPPLTLRPHTLYEMRVRFLSQGPLYLTVKEPDNPFGDRTSGMYVDSTYSDKWRWGNMVYANYSNRPTKRRFVISLKYQGEDFLGATYDLPLEGDLDLWIDQVVVERLGDLPRGMATAGEFHPYHHLETHVSRGMIKPNPKLRRPDGAFPGERVDFVDEVTGVHVMKMTRDTCDSWHTYPNCMPWNSAADRFAFSSLRPIWDPSRGSIRGGYKFVMAADGSWIRPLVNGETKWDVTDPDRLYTFKRTAKPRGVVLRLDRKTGRLLKSWDWLELAPSGSRSRAGMLGPQHPVTKKLLVKQTVSGAAGRASRFYALDPPPPIPPGDPKPAVVGPTPIFHLPFRTNQFYWTQDEFDAFEFNFNPTSPGYGNPDAGREGQYRVDYKRGKLFRFCRVHGSHRSYEWPSRGRRMARVTAFGLVARDITSDDERCLITRPANPYRIGDMHSDWSALDGTLGSSLGVYYYIADMRPWPMKATAGDPGVRGWTRNVHRVALTAHRNRMYRSEAHAALSPDGTKVAYMSNMTGAVEVYHAVIRRPRAPRNVRVRLEDGGVRVTWEAPEHGREIVGYFVFASEESGRGFRLLTPEPVKAARFDDRDPKAAKRFYVVSAVEGSGVVSAFSRESTLNMTAPRRLFFGALDATFLDGAARRLDGRAAEYAALGLSALNDNGAAAVRVNVPRDGSYRLFARVRVEPNGRRFTSWPAVSWSADGLRLRTERLLAIRRYHWVSLTRRPVPMTSGERELWISPSDVRVLVDTLCLTDDPGFTPTGAGRILDAAPAPPGGPSVRADGPFMARLTWARSRDPLVARFHVYAVGGTDVYSGRRVVGPVLRGNRHRLATTADTSTADWGLKPNTVYRYRVTAVNRFGVEGPLSQEAVVKTPPLQVEAIRQAPKGRPPKLSFHVRRGGAYVLWAKVRSLETDRARKRHMSARTRFSLVLDGGAPRAWRPRFDLVSIGHAGPFKDQPFWDRVPLGPPIWYPVVDLNPGAHTLTIKWPKGAKMKIDEFLLTNDLSHRPKGVTSFILRTEDKGVLR